MSDFLDRVRRRRCSISITLMKLDFNVHAVSACICKQYHGRRKKLDHLPQNLKVSADFFKRQLRRKRNSFLSRKNRCKKQQAFAKRPKVKGGQSSWSKYFKIVHLVFCESFNKYSDRFHLQKRGDRSLALLDILKTSLPSVNVSIVFCCSS